MKRLTLIIFSFFISCNTEIERNININLSFGNNKNNLFTEKIIPLNFVSNKNNFTGIPKNLDYWETFILNNDVLFEKDSLSPNFGNNAKYTYVLSGKKNDSIVMIIDEDNDKNFSNNDKIIFEGLTKTPRSELFNYSLLTRSSIYEKDNSNYKYRVFPFPNYYTSTKNKEANEIQLVITPYGHWCGEFENFGDSYKVVLKNYFPKDRSEILFSEIKDSFQTIRNNDYFSYKELEKIRINNNIYLIDSLVDNRSNLTLKYLKQNKLNSIGLREGFTFSNYNLEFLNADKKSIEELLNSKDYLLIDFWGTWCAPCVELIPEVKNIFRQYKNVQVLGVVLDEEKNRVSDFIYENNITYPNHFISFEEEYKSEKHVIGEQKISNYPYYILLDKNRKIIYRGFGKKSLEKIISIIK